MRIKRGTLTSEREGGRVYVLLGRRPISEQPTEQPTDHTEELIATLQKQLEAEREANRENRRIIAALTARIPELEPPSKTRGSPETVDEQQGRGQPRSGTAGSQEGMRKPWWRRVFGG